MLRLLIVRHGNTFDPGDTVLRVGKRTDLPLSLSGQEQAKKIGCFLRKHYASIDEVFVSSLKRTQETAAIALPELSIHIQDIFDEIDYGVDDGQPESQVLARIGRQALTRWEEESIPPEGWKVDPKKIIDAWQNFAKGCVERHPAGATILVVTSNGIARFALSLQQDLAVATPKMRTGAISALFYDINSWHIDYWDVRPE